MEGKVGSGVTCRQMKSWWAIKIEDFILSLWHILEVLFGDFFFYL